jgi:hypothetical protein
MKPQRIRDPKVRELASKHPLHGQKQIVDLFRVSTGSQTERTDIEELNHLNDLYEQLRHEFGRAKHQMQLDNHEQVEKRMRELWYHVQERFRYMNEVLPFVRQSIGFTK